MDTIKTRQQTLNLSALHTITATLKHEGIRGFYKGMLSPLLTIGPINSLFFGVYGNVLQLLQHNANSEGRVDWTDPSWKKNVFLAGCVGGFAQCFIICPVELIKIELQLNTQDSFGKNSHTEIPHKTPWSVTKYIVQQRGVPGLFRGFVPTMWRDIIPSGCYFLGYQAILESLEQRFPHYHSLNEMVSGGLTGVFSWVFVIPFDVVKSRIQADSTVNPKYHGMIDCMVKSYREEGASIFGKGFTVCMVRAFPVNAAIFFAYEVAIEFMHSLHGKTKH
ncbi:solute carrier family 25 member 45-like isoform X1 [Agrilus planipennis]|uniref:Solute carrier family 25 member 45-like isoform X1 n=1 Tax=Agrilus planipennis TaxID=224129 RepID=A0A1W4XAW6_AGRPL|nr:solute carrier family 25 member 45-like isoform X1 [Agrilus planipennis]